MAPCPAKVSPLTRRVPPSVSLEVIASFACCGTDVREMRISGFCGVGRRRFRRGTAGMSGETCFLVCVSVCGSDCRHEPYSPFHAIPKFHDSRCFGGADDEHHVHIRQRSPLPRSHTGGFARTLEWSSHGEDGLSAEVPQPVTKKKQTYCTREDTRCKRERDGFIQASNSTHLFLSLDVKSLCRTQPIAEDASNIQQ